MPNITREMIQEVSLTLLEVLSKEKIEDVSGLERMMGKTLPGKNEGEEILFVLAPSNMMTAAYGISYGKHGHGVPVEVKINPQLGYTSFVVKSESEFQGYAAFMADPYGNLIQQKKIDTADIEGVKQELESLAKGHDLIERNTSADRN